MFVLQASSDVTTNSIYSLSFASAYKQFIIFLNEVFAPKFYTAVAVSLTSVLKKPGSRLQDIVVVLLVEIG